MPEESIKTVSQETRATLKYARISSRKVKIVADLVRGKKVNFCAIFCTLCFTRSPKYRAFYMHQFFLKIHFLTRRLLIGYT